MTAPDLLAALMPVGEALDALGVRFYVGGSVASSTHGVPRASIDADVIAGLLRARAGQLDSAYLRKWAEPLGVADLLERAFQESS